MKRHILLFLLLIASAYGQSPSDYSSNNPDKMGFQLVKFFKHFYNGEGNLYAVAKNRNEEPISYEIKENGDLCEYNWESERIIVQSSSIFKKYFYKLGIKPELTLGGYKLSCATSWSKDKRLVGKTQCHHNLNKDYILENQICKFGKVSLMYDETYYPNLYQAARVWHGEIKKDKIFGN